MSQDQQLSAEEREAVGRERAARLEERPEGAEVDNTQRDFDVAKGMFTDSPGYGEAPERFPAAAQPDEPPEDQVGPDDQPSVDQVGPDDQPSVES